MRSSEARVGEATPDRALSAPIAEAFARVDDDARRFMQHVVTLSDPFFEGRVAGSRGARDAAEYVAFHMQRLGLEPRGEGAQSGGGSAARLNSYFQSFGVPAPADGPDERVEGRDRDDVSPEDEQARDVAALNVLGALPGSGGLSNEWVVIGAHYDHLGEGWFGSRSPESAGEIHPGADDNASGVAGVLVAAERLAEAREAGRLGASHRSLLFVAFAAEEMGLLGSQALLEEAPVPTDDIVAMINLDMIGRLDEELLIAGTGTGKDLGDRVRPIAEASGLPVRFAESGWLPSDQVAFLSTEIPSLSFFTGVHDDYHTVRDVGWRVRHAPGARIAALVADVAESLATEPQRFAYVSIDPPSRGVGRGRNAPVRLGVRPAEYLGEEPGVLVGDVYQGTSAAEGGVKKGDLIVAWDGVKIDGPGALMQRLRGHEPGDFITLTVLRDGERTVLPVTLRARE